MNDIKNINSNMNKKDLNHELYKAYVTALKDEDFKKLIVRLKIDEETAKKYTAKLEMTVTELNNCKKCKSIMECKNRVHGCVFYPRINGKQLSFDYNACKYFQEHLANEKNKAIFYEEPDAIKNARMSDIDLTDKKRTHVIKWINKFYKDYQKNKNIKGAYLHGSFGSGKSFLLAALINELAKTGAKCTMVYYQEMLRILKESFYDDFDVKMHNLKTCDVLLIDDIGAEIVTEWSRDEILGTILQYRMDSKLPTFFTSNMTIEELEKHLIGTKNNADIVKAKRIIERIKFLTEDLELISENRRK